MPDDQNQKPVGDSVAKSGAVAVGEDLQFQQAWWRFERVVWVVFGLILLADLSGLLGRGPLSKAEKHTPDGALTAKYEFVERANTPSIVTILPGAPAMRNGSLHVFVSDSIVKDLGAQRVIPQPSSSTLGGGGVTYVFPATALPILIQIELRPSFVGLHRFRIGVPGRDAVEGKIFVLP